MNDMHGCTNTNGYVIRTQRLIWIDMNMIGYEIRGQPTATLPTFSEQNGRINVIKAAIRNFVIFNSYWATSFWLIRQANDFYVELPVQI